MIHSLVVHNIALIKKLNIEFSDGLNVLSGETGAGKSIIVDSMNLVLGERADREMIRSGQDSASVEAILYIDKDQLQDVFSTYGITAEEELIISRELSSGGKNICRINGVAVNLSTLKGLMDHIVDLHGQHQHQSLLYPQNHMEMIDGIGGENLQKIKNSISEKYDFLKTLQVQLSGLGGDEEERKNTIELLQFQIDELFAAKLAPDELEALHQEREILANAEHIASALQGCYDALYLGEHGQSILGGLKSCVDGLLPILSYDPRYAALFKKLNEYYYLLEESAHDLNGFAEEIVFDEQRQAAVEERIEQINMLKRKYHAADEQALLDYMDQAQTDLEQLLNATSVSKQLAEDIQTTKDDLYQQYQELSAERRKAAKILEKRILYELADLGMPDASFEARFSDIAPPDKLYYSRSGADEMEFYISTNAGEPLKPLAKTASGGEISRIMLAFKTVLAENDQISTMIFDEIDTGISGQMAHVVAEKMAAIACYRQVICVTHLPQIAAMADRHFLISKQTTQNTTITNICQLDEEQRAEELVRLSGGIETENARAYAGELLENAHKIKKRYKNL